MGCDWLDGDARGLTPDGPFDWVAVAVLPPPLPPPPLPLTPPILLVLLFPSLAEFASSFVEPFVELFIDFSSLLDFLLSSSLLFLPLCLLF